MRQTGAGEALLTIGELSAQTGMSPQLLRTWEARFGFPAPVRLASGHRRYTEDDVRAVRRVIDERNRGLQLEQAIHVSRRFDQVTTSGSVYASLATRHVGLSSYTLTKATLLALSWAIEDEAVAQNAQGTLIGMFQRHEFYERSHLRWAELARTARTCLVMADFPHHDDRTRPARVALPPDSALLREWIVIHDSPPFSAALVAYELPGQVRVPDGTRRFEALWTLDGPTVRDAAGIALQVGISLGSTSASRGLAHLEEAPGPHTSDVRAANAVFNRMIAYVDGNTASSPRERNG